MAAVIEKPAKILPSPRIRLLFEGSILRAVSSHGVTSAEPIVRSTSEREMKRYRRKAMKLRMRMLMISLDTRP
jgi:hypothetical protein